MAKQTFTTGQVLTAAQVNALQTNDFNQTVSAKTASYVLVAADKGTRIEFSTSGSVTCTVNTGLFDAGDTVYIQNTGAGVVTITAGTATVNTSASLALNQWEGGLLYFISASAAIWYEYASTAMGDITGVTAGTGISGGGTSGTVTITNSMATAIDAKGDLVVGTADNTFSRLIVGANDTVLTADSAQSTGLKWAAIPASSGPAFRAYRATSNVSFSGSTWVKVQLNAETFDTDNCFDPTTNYRFTPTKAGYYLFDSTIKVGKTGQSRARAAIYKNGVIASQLWSQINTSTDYQYSGSALIYLNGSTDYAELYINDEDPSGRDYKFGETSDGTWLSGIWIRS